MSLPNVEWRYVGKQPTSSLSVSQLLDQIYDLASRTTYADGTSRTQGSGSAGTWQRYQNSGVTEAVYVTPTVGSQAIIMAGSSGTPSPSPTMASPHTYSTYTLMAALIKNPGSFSSWNDANPFTSGSNTGYSRFLGSRSGTTGLSGGYGSVNIHLYESKESVALFMVEAGAADTSSYANGFIAGALWDSESSNSLDCESDGRLYGIINSGHYNTSSSATSINATNIWGRRQFTDSTQRGSTWTSIGFLAGDGGNATGPVCKVFLPGSGTVATASMMMYPLDAVSSPSEAQLTTNSMTTRSDSYVRIPMIYRFGATTASATYANNVLGRLRNISLCKRGTIGQRHMNGSSTIGHVVSCSEVSSSDAILLEY